MAHYRQLVYEKGVSPSFKGKALDQAIVNREAKRRFAPGAVDRFRYRTRYFSDRGIIGTREFVRRCWRMFQAEDDPRDKCPRPVAGQEGVDSLKRLSETQGSR